MTFTLLPAVDVADGRAVGLTRGPTGRGTVHGDALDAALVWQADGAEWIHLVDLDAAFDRGSNSDLLASMIDALYVKVELSGGIRDDTSLERALATGCTRVILATSGLKDPAWCARYIVTDVSKDGMMRGPNLELYRAVTRATATPVIASGGISAISDLVALATPAGAGATSSNLEGSIVGAALYAGRFTLPEALAAMRHVDTGTQTRN